jgi:hypothetical protein
MSTSFFTSIDFLYKPLINSSLNKNFYYNAYLSLYKSYFLDISYLVLLRYRYSE